MRRRGLADGLRGIGVIVEVEVARREDGSLAIPGKSSGSPSAM